MPNFTADSVHANSPAFGPLANIPRSLHSSSMTVGPHATGEHGVAPSAPDARTVRDAVDAIVASAVVSGAGWTCAVRTTERPLHWGMP